MSKITSSASKLVLLYVVFILGALTTFACAWDVVHSQFSEVTKILLGSFGAGVNFLFGFYFGSKGETFANGDSMPFGGK